MTDKITLTDVSTFDDSALAAINSNMATITTAIDNTLSRDGTSPNTMGADIDMNSNDLINTRSIYMSSTSPGSPANGQIWYDGTSLHIQLGGVTKTFNVT